MMQSGCWDDFILKNHFRVIPSNWLYNFDIWHFDKLLSAGEENVPWNVYAALTTTIRNKWNHLISEQKNMIFAARRHTHSYTYSQALPDKWNEWKRCNRLNIDSNIFYMQKMKLNQKNLFVLIIKSNQPNIGQSMEMCLWLRLSRPFNSYYFRAFSSFLIFEPFNA